MAKKYKLQWKPTRAVVTEIVNDLRSTYPELAHSYNIARDLPVYEWGEGIDFEDPKLDLSRGIYPVPHKIMRERLEFGDERGEYADWIGNHVDFDQVKALLREYGFDPGEDGDTWSPPKPKPKRAAPKPKGKARVSAKLREGVGSPSTYLVFDDRDEFDLALTFRPLNDMMAEVDSASMQMRLWGAKDSPSVKSHVKFLRKTVRKPGYRADDPAGIDKYPVIFRVYNPHPPRPFRADRPGAKAKAKARPAGTKGSKHLGPLLRKGREAKGISLASLASTMGIAPSTLGGIERGKIRCPPQGRLTAAAKRLGVAAATLTHANDCDYGKAKPMAKKKTTKKAPKRAKNPAKKAAKKASASVKVTLEVVKYAVGDYHWNVLSPAGRKLDTGKSKKKATAVKTVKAKGRKRGLEDGKVKARDATDAERSRHGARKKGRKAKVAKNRCARKGSITSAARKELPSKAFAVPSTRSYPLYKLGGDGKLVPSASHAGNAKARAKQALNRGRLSKGQYSAIVRKANKVLSLCSPAVRKARTKAKSSTRAKVKRELSRREQQAILNAAVRELAGV